MVTNKIIKEEVDELKTLLSQEELNIPSFWSCIWPGLLCMTWFLLSSYLTYGIHEFANQLIWKVSMAFAGVMGILSIAITANTRAIFLSVPESFRRKSIFFKFLARKLKVYGIVFLAIFTCSALLFSHNKIGALEFSLSTGFVFFITMMIMNIDLSRYQLSTLISVMRSFKESKDKLD